MNEVEQVRRAEQAKQILDSPLWAEAWELYRTRTLTIIEGAGSDDVDTVMHAKRMLFAGAAARKHLEAIIADGKVAAADIERGKASILWPNR